MCPLATTASLSALASEKAANPGRAAAAGCTVHVGQRGVALHSNSLIPSSSNLQSDNVFVGLRALQQQRGLQG